MESIFEEINQDYGLPNVELGRRNKRNSTPAPPSVKSNCSAGDSAATGPHSASRCHSSTERDFIDCSPSTSGENDPDSHSSRRPSVCKGPAQSMGTGRGALPTAAASGSAIRVRMSNERMHGETGAAPINLPNAAYIDAQPVRSKFSVAPQARGAKLPAAAGAVLEENTQKVLCVHTKQWTTVSVRPKFRWHNECVFSLDAFYQGRSTNPPDFYSITPQGVTKLQIVNASGGGGGAASNPAKAIGGPPAVTVSNNNSATKLNVTLNRGACVTLGSLPTDSAPPILVPASDFEASAAKKRKHLPTESVQYINATTKKNDLGFQIAARPLKVRTVRDPETGIVKRYPMNCAPSSSTNSVSTKKASAKSGDINGSKAKRPPRPRKRPAKQETTLPPVFTPCVPHEASTSSQSSPAVAQVPTAVAAQSPSSAGGEAGGQSNANAVTALMINGTMFALPAGAKVVVLNQGDAAAEHTGQMPLVSQSTAGVPVLTEFNAVTDSALPSVYPELPSIQSVHQCEQSAYQPNNESLCDWGAQTTADGCPPPVAPEKAGGGGSFDDILMTAWRATIDDPAEGAGAMPHGHKLALPVAAATSTLHAPAEQQHAGSDCEAEQSAGAVLTPLEPVANCAQSDCGASGAPPADSQQSPLTSQQSSSSNSVSVADIITNGVLTQHSPTMQNETVVSWSVESISNAVSASTYLADDFVNQHAMAAAHGDMSSSGEHLRNDVVLGTTLTQQHCATGAGAGGTLNLLSLKDCSIDCSAGVIDDVPNCQLSDELKSHMQAIGDFTFDTTLTELSTADVGCTLSQLSATLTDVPHSSMSMSAAAMLSSAQQCATSYAMSTVMSEPCTSFVYANAPSLAVKVEPQSVSAALSTITTTIPDVAAKQVDAPALPPFYVGASSAAPTDAVPRVGAADGDGRCHISPLAPTGHGGVDLAALVDANPPVALTADGAGTHCQISSLAAGRHNLDLASLVHEPTAPVDSDAALGLASLVDAGELHKNRHLPSVGNSEFGRVNAEKDEPIAELASPDRPGPVLAATLPTSSSPVHPAEGACDAMLLGSQAISHSVANLLWQPKAEPFAEAASSCQAEAEPRHGLFTPPHESSAAPPVPRCLLAGGERTQSPGAPAHNVRTQAQTHGRVAAAVARDEPKCTDAGSSATAADSRPEETRDNEMTVLESLQLLEDSLCGSAEEPAGGTGASAPSAPAAERRSPIAHRSQSRGSQHKATVKSDCNLQVEEDECSTDEEPRPTLHPIADTVVETRQKEEQVPESKQRERPASPAVVSSKRVEVESEEWPAAKGSAAGAAQSPAAAAPTECHVTSPNAVVKAVPPCRFNLWDRLNGVTQHIVAKVEPAPEGSVGAAPATSRIVADSAPRRADPIKLKIKKCYAAAAAAAVHPAPPVKSECSAAPGGPPVAERAQGNIRLKIRLPKPPVAVKQEPLSPPKHGALPQPDSDSAQRRPADLKIRIKLPTAPKPAAEAKRVRKRDKRAKGTVHVQPPSPPRQPLVMKFKRPSPYQSL